MKKHSYFYLEMKEHHLKVPYTGKNRRIRVLLPKGYAEDLDRSYPVVYMNDGQNVFYSGESFSGHSWKVIPAIKRNPDMPRMIIVGIDNDNEGRMNEYAPWKFSNAPLLSFGLTLGGLGSEYADFFIKVVKPFIDKTYRTKPEREYTAMIGSSLGANIAQYIGLEHKDKVGALGIFSSANWLNKVEFDRYIAKHKLENQKVYIELGTKEGDDTDRELTHGNRKQSYISTTLDYYRQLIEAGLSTKDIKLNVVADGEHSEECWSKYLPECLRFISEEW